MATGDQIIVVPAGGAVGLGSSGVLFAYKSENNNTPIDVTVDGAERRMEVGDVIGVPRNARLRIVNTDQTNPITVRVFHGDDIYQASKVAGSVGVSSINGEGITDYDDQTVTGGASAEVAPAKTGRRSVIIQSLAANGNNVRVGTSNVTATRGLEVGPGDSITLETADAVHVHAITSNADIAVMEIG